MSTASLILGLAMALVDMAPSGNHYPSLATAYARAVANAGNPAPLYRVFAKARSGAPIVVAAVGGSVTEGARATQPKYRWANQMASWWKQAFPHTKVTFLNAGIGATGSDFAVHRLQRQLLGRKPDFVVVEFSVNDPPSMQEQYEGVIRQLLASPNHPAVMTLHMVSQSGYSAENIHLPVARHYDLPAISYCRALWPEITAGRLSWQDISPDSIHPNDMGHTFAAALINTFLQKTLENFQPSTQPLQSTDILPKPLKSNRFDTGTMLSLDQLEIIENKGFTLVREPKYGRYGPFWRAQGPQAKIAFKVTGPLVSVLYSKLNKPFGKAAVWLDGKHVATLDGFHPHNWIYTPVREIFRDLPGEHTLEFVTLNDKNPRSTGYGFEIIGIMTASPQP